MNTPAASVIISIYNKFNYLERVLAGFEQQSRTDFEVILADDGSNGETLAAIRQYQQQAPYPLRHVWHEDKGFRKTRIMNKAVVAAEASFLIFVDGDCIPHPRFVEEHLAHAREGVVLCGRRANLSDKLTHWLTPERIRQGALQHMTGRLLWDSVAGQSRDAEKAIYIRNSPLKPLFPQKFKGLLGCNFSLYKKDLLDINGFDERYEAPAAGEDTDPEYRLGWAGKKFVSVKNYAIQYHLYHKLLPRPEQSQRVLAQVLKERKAYSRYGIQQAGRESLS
ncbi:glycosyltransferase [Cesiribacter andamanensis]|uniref:glycosyltransferase n=1 Tax=Cesiribacter andamanensis TaxID=649507 RepID=UPI00058C8B7B|nr:glycosyltransferase [Cesiribacter andamanensis]